VTLGQRQAGILTTDRLQTITYMAPEVWNEGVADERADCYSLGVVGFELLNGAHPFAGMKEDQLRDMHMKNSPCAKPDYERDSDFATLIDSLMCPDVSLPMGSTT
jgi:serine/threonine protein kinase